MRPIPFNSYWRSTSIVKTSYYQEDALLLNFSVESAENWEKQQKVATPLLFYHSERACLVLYPETKYETTKSKAVKKRQKIRFTKNLNFLRIDRADYGASWTLSIMTVFNYVVETLWNTLCFNLRFKIKLRHKWRTNAKSPYTFLTRQNDKNVYLKNIFESV